MMPFIDIYYQAKEGTPDTILLTLTEEIHNEYGKVYASLRHLPIYPALKSKADCLEDYLELVIHRVRLESRAVENKEDTLHFTYINEFLNLLTCSSEKQIILESLLNSRFDKRSFQSYLTHSIIFGADEGIYLLLNTISKKEQKSLLLDSHVNHEIMSLIINENGKIVIGEGSFGKIRMAMALVPNKKSHSSLIGGNIICMKKAGSKKKNKTQLEIYESTWNDYSSIDFLDDAPEIYDMKVTTGCDGQSQGYCFQKLLMLPNGVIFYKNNEYQKWVHVKQYFIGIFRLMIELHDKGICMTDLKPANTLYDRKTQTAKLVDLAGVVRHERLNSCQIKNVKEATPKYTAPELLDENVDDNEQEIDLTKCIAWTVGHMLEEISRQVNEFKEPNKNKKVESIKSQIHSLCNDLKIVSPKERISLQQGLQRLLKIPDLEAPTANNFQKYVSHLKDKLDIEDPEIQRILNLKNEIYTLYKCFNEKLKITARNPEKYDCDPANDKSISDLLPTIEKMIYQNKSKEIKKEAFILFGSAGSGKSTVLQKIFLDAIKGWKIGDPIPIFMNLAIDYDLKNFWKHLIVSLAIFDLPFEDLIKLPVVLFLDSLDESRMDLRIITNIFNSLSSYSNVNEIKIVLTCRTGYLNEDNEEKMLKGKINLNNGYIIPLDSFFFDEVSNLEHLIKLYLKNWEKKKDSHIEQLVPQYLQKIQQYRLKEMMKTTYMIFIIFKVLPKLMETDTSSKIEINLLTIYAMYIENNLQTEISRSNNKFIKQKSVSWFMQIGILLAEHMIITKKSTNQLKKRRVFQFLAESLIQETGDPYNTKIPLTENINIYNILRTLNVDIHFEKKPPNEEITISFPHDTIKNFFLAKGFADKLHSCQTFPNWLTQKVFAEDQNLVRFMIEVLKNSSELAFASEQAIFLTRASNDAKVINRAANLITFLVASNYSFYGKDLSHIKIKGANISDGIFHECNFDNADLSKVTLNNSKLDNASFENTNLDKTKIDIYPYIKGDFSAVRSVAFSPAGDQIVSGSYDSIVRILDVETGKEVKKFEGHSGAVYSVAYSQNGEKIVSGSEDKTLILWNAETCKELKKFQGHTSFVISVAISTNALNVVSGSDDKAVILWDVEAGIELKRFLGHSGYICSVAFSPLGDKIVSGGDDRTIRIWSTETGAELTKIKGHSDTVYSIAFSPSGQQIVSSSDDRKIKIWDVETGNEIQRFDGHLDAVLSAVFSPNGERIASGSHDRTVRIWDVETGRELKKYEGHLETIRSVAFSPQGDKIVSCSDDKTIRIWDEEVRKELKKYEGHFDNVHAVAFSPDGGRIASGSGDKTVRLWDKETGKELKKYDGHLDVVRAVAFSSDGIKIVSGSKDQTVRIWEVETGKEIQKYEGHSETVLSVAFSPNGSIIASCSEDKTVRIWCVVTRKELKKYEGSDFVYSLAFSPHGDKIAFASDDNIVRLWDLDNWKEFKKIVGHNYAVLSVAFSPNGDRIVSGSHDRTARVWDVETGKELKKFDGHCKSVYSVIFSPNGNEIVSCSSDKTVRVWDVETKKELKKFEGHSRGLNSIALTNDGGNLVSGSEDKTIRIWNLENMNYLNKIEHKHNSLIISSSATVFSCFGCRNYEKSINCPPRLLLLFEQNDKC